MFLIEVNGRWFLDTALQILSLFTLLFVIIYIKLPFSAIRFNFNRLHFGKGWVNISFSCYNCLQLLLFCVFMKGVALMIISLGGWERGNCQMCCCRSIAEMKTEGCLLSVCLAFQWKERFGWMTIKARWSGQCCGETMTGSMMKHKAKHMGSSSTSRFWTHRKHDNEVCLPFLGSSTRNEKIPRTFPVSPDASNFRSC